MHEAISNFYDGRRVLITGGLGFIGSNLAIRLVDLGAQVTLADAMVPETGANPFNIGPIRDQVDVHIVDMRDVDAIASIVPDQQLIFNLAAQVSHVASMRDPFTDLEINCRSQLSLLESCRRQKHAAKVIFASTRQIYGKPERLPVDELHPLQPVDFNGIHKLAAELYHRLYDDVYGIRACSLRLTTTYGPRMLVKNDHQTFVGWFIRQALDGEEIQIYGDGEQLRDLNYVDDACDAFLLAGASEEADGEVFNLGGTEPVSLRHLVELLLEIVGYGSYRLVPFPAEKKPIDIGSFHADFGKITRVLGWLPQTGLREGLERTVAFYLGHRPEYWPAGGHRNRTDHSEMPDKSDLRRNAVR